MISPLIITRNPTKIVKEADEVSETLTIIDIPQIFIKPSVLAIEDSPETLKDNNNPSQEGSIIKIKPSRNFK